MMLSGDKRGTAVPPRARTGHEGAAYLPRFSDFPKESLEAQWLVHSVLLCVTLPSQSCLDLGTKVLSSERESRLLE